jgi:hypothetical protein
MLEGKVGEIHKKVFEPGTPTEKLDKVLNVLGVQTSPVTSIQFNRLIPFKAGAHQVFEILTAGGYSGPSKVQELTLCNKAEDGSSFYRGDSATVNDKTGVELQDCDTERASGGQRDFIDTTKIYLYTAKPSRLAVLVRALQ